MRILWLTNNCPSFLADEFKLETTNSQGWLDVLGKKICEKADQAVFIFQNGKAFQSASKKNVSLFVFPREFSLKKKYEVLERYFLSIIDWLKPDIIHIHGTEFFHSYPMFLAAKRRGLEKKVVVSIQGLMHVYEKLYLGNLPTRVVNRYTIGDLIRSLNLRRVQGIYRKRSKSEIDLLKSVNFVIGRTEWDRCHVGLLNKKVEYFKCNECLREQFYSGEWDYHKCEKHSIFVSQSSNPIKGMHHAIEALNIVSKTYEDSKLYVTGHDVFRIPFYKIDSYHKYLKELILKYGLRDKVVFLGNLDADKMKEAFLKSNVFILPSSIENSPNSLGEAMILGVPCVSSYVGGVPTIFGEKDGYLYNYEEPSMLAHYISKVFEQEECKSMTTNARKHASLTHDVEKNFETLMKIYEDICSR